MYDKLPLLEETLEAMLFANEDITARNAVRNSNGVFRHASDITRHEARRQMLSDFEERQRSVRSALERSAKPAREALELQLALRTEEVNSLEKERQLLIASHRAMMLVVAEMGGYQTWRSLFDRFEPSLKLLTSLGALPEAEIKALPPGRTAASEGR